jgi:hypothetical protein
VQGSDGVYPRKNFESLYAERLTIISLETYFDAGAAITHDTSKNKR